MNPHAHIPKNFDTLEVGAWYMDREGDTKECIAHNPDGDEEYKFRTHESYYCPNGNLLVNEPSEFDLTHRVNPDGSLWTGEAPEAKRQTHSGGITVRAVTLELTQTLPSGEEQTIIVEVTGTDEIITTDPSWTNGAVGLSDIIGTAITALDMAKGRIAKIAEGV